MNTFELHPPLVSNPARQASASLQGYDYQILRSVEAWLTLGPGEILYLEGGEDFDLVHANGAVAVQVKNSTASLTLASEAVRKTINNFQFLSERNEARAVRVNFMTRGEAAFEKERPFGPEKGLDVWGKAASGDAAAIAGLRRYLLNAGWISDSLRNFLAQADPELLRERFFQRIAWCLGEPSMAVVRASVEDMVVRLGRECGISPSRSLLALPGMIDHCREVAARAEALGRNLTFERKLTVFEKCTSITVPGTPENLRIFAHQLSVDEALREFASREELTRIGPPPASMRLKPLPQILGRSSEPETWQSIETAAILTGEQERPNELFVEARSRAITLMDQWANQFQNELKLGRLDIYDGHVKLTVRDPQSEAECETFIWAPATVSAKWELTKELGEAITLTVKDTANRVNSLGWHLEEKISAGACSTVSTIRHVAHVNPQFSDNFREREKFYEYMEVVEKLAAGWKPVAFVSRNVGKSACLDPVYPLSFRVDCEIGRSEFDVALARCSKISLVYELADELEIRFVFNDTFFNPALTEALVENSLRQFVSTTGRRRGPEGRLNEVIVSLSSFHGVRLAFWRGYLCFETVRIWRPRAVGAIVAGW